MLWTLLKFTTTDVAMSVAAMSFCGWLGVKGGNAASRSIIARLRNDPAEAFWSACLVAPIAEEIVFRGIPAIFIWMFCKSVGIHWGWAFWTSLVFALVHGIEDDDGDFVLPLPQFLGGLLLWYVARTHGLCYAMMVHGLSNAVALFCALA